MKGFKEFLMQGNLIELAVAVIIGASFGEVVKTFTGVIMGFVGMFGGTPDFSKFAPFGLPIGVFINAVVAFAILAAIIYFFVITPYNKMKDAAEKRKKAEEEEKPAEPTTDELLAEIRDLLKAKNA